MRLMASGTFILATLLLCAPLSTSAAEIGITDVGTDAYPDGGLRLMTELETAGPSAKNGAIAFGARKYFHQDSTRYVRRDLDSLAEESFLPRMPRIRGPYHMAFRENAEWGLLFANPVGSDGLILWETDPATARAGEYTAIDFPGVAFGAETSDPDVVAIVSDSSPITVGTFSFDSTSEIDRVVMPSEAGTFSAAAYSPGLHSLMVLSEGDAVRLSIIDVATLSVSSFVDFPTEFASVSGSLVTNDSGDTAWLFDDTDTSSPAKVMRIDPDTGAIGLEMDLESDQLSVLSAFLGADESLLVLQTSTTILTLNPTTLELIDDLEYFGLERMHPHQSGEFAIVRLPPIGGGPVGVLSLSPLQEVATAPSIKSGTASGLWDPNQFFENVHTGTTFLVGDTRTSNNPRATALSHSPFEMTNAMGLSPGMESRQAFVDEDSDLLVSVDRYTNSSSFYNQLTVFSTVDEKPIRVYSDQIADFHSPLIEPNSGDVIIISRSGAALRRFDAATMTVSAESQLLAESMEILGMALDDSEGIVYAVGEDAHLRSLDAQTLQVMNSMPIPDISQFVAIDQVRQRAYVGPRFNVPNQYVYEISLEDWELSDQIPLPSSDPRPQAMVLDPDRGLGWITTSTSTTVNRMSALDLESRVWLGSISVPAAGQRVVAYDTDRGRVLQTSELAFRNPAFISIAQQGYIKATRLSVPSTADVEFVHLYAHQAAGNIRAAIYADGIDKTLFWQSDPTAVSVADAFLEIPIADGAPATLELPAGDYWLAWQVDNIDSVMSYAGESAGDGFLSVQDFGDFPSTLAEGEITVTGEQWTGYITAELAPIPGDIDGNGVLSVADVTLLAAMLSGHVIDEPNPEVADLNGDEIVDEADLQILVEMIVEP